MNRVSGYNVDGTTAIIVPVFGRIEHGLGTSDAMILYRENVEKQKILYVLCRNERLGYCGIAQYHPPENDECASNTPVAQVFFQTPDEELGENWSDWSDHKLASVLKLYL